MEQLIEQNIIKINNAFTSKFIKKRIINELNILYKLYDKVEVDCSLQNNSIIIYDIKNNKTQKYKFDISESHPFIPPKIYYNNTCYFEYFIINSKTLKKLLYTMYGIDCFCCNSFTCQNKWNPSHSLSDIVNEINKFKSYRRNVINKIYADKIKLKYLINDINLDEWIF